MLGTLNGMRVRKRVPAAKIVVYVLLSLVAVTFIFPYLWLIASSFKDTSAIFSEKFSLIPRDEAGNIKFVLSNYSQAIQELKLGLVFKNTLIVCVVNTFVNLFLNSLAAYAFARLEFPGRDKIFGVLLVTMMVPGTVLTIPNFIIVNALNIYDTLFALILPFTMSVYNVFLLRQQYYALSSDIEGAAMIDGASTFRIYAQISLPMVSPMLVVLGITTFMWNYNNYMWPLIATRSEENFTLAISLGELVATGQSDVRKYPAMLAGAVIVSAPLIIIFFVLQKYIIAGIMVGGVKE
ncbi:MAG: carbohydrate ABC transporter permease [Eubacteriales bacterium]